MPTKFIKNSRDFNDVAEDHATAINLVNNEETKRMSSNNNTFTTKPQNRDTETYVSEMRNPVDDYYNTKTDPPRGYGVGASGIVSPTGTAKNDVIKGGSGRVIWRGGTDYNSSKTEYASTPYGKGYRDNSSSVTSNSNSNVPRSPKPGVVFKGASTKDLVPPYKPYKPKK